MKTNSKKGDLIMKFYSKFISFMFIWIILVCLLEIGLILRDGYTLSKEQSNNQQVYGKSIDNDEAKCFVKCNGNYHYEYENNFKNRVCECEK